MHRTHRQWRPRDEKRKWNINVAEVAKSAEKEVKNVNELPVFYSNGHAAAAAAAAFFSSAAILAHAAMRPACFVLRPSFLL